MAVIEMFDHISRAIVRLPGRELATAATIGVPDAARAASQHNKYADALRQCGVDVVTLPADPALPQACLVGSTAVMTDQLAVIGNFSESSLRQGEQKSVATALIGDRFLKFITAPGLLDGEDVLRIGNHFYIALSGQTNQEGAAQLAFFLTEFGYGVTMLEQSPENAVRLNTAAAYLGQNALLVREELARNFAFLSFDKIIVPYRERGAAASILVNGTVLMPAGYAQTAAAVKETGIPVIELNISEFEKIGASLKTLSLRLPKAAVRDPVQLPQNFKKTGAL